MQLNCATKSVILEYWNDGTKKLTRQQLKEKERVIKRSYFANGSLEYESEYLKNIPDGTTTYWYPNGQLKSRTIYSNGLLHSNMEKFYESGELQYSVGYFYGKKNGFERWYYSNGQIKSESMFNSGELTGKITRWSKNGKLLYQ